MIARMQIDLRDTESVTNAILTFWFGEGDEHGLRRAQWFKKDDAFDEQIRQRFLGSYEAGAAGTLAHWQADAGTCLALIVLLDQFPRNMFRGSPRAFAADALACDAARVALAKGFDREMKPVERQFVYLPLEHSESLADQLKCLSLMRGLAGFAETADLHIWAEKHLVIIERFGRFPHRNAALGRTNTPDEIEFLAQPGSGF